jgi:DNA-binding transcriptional ArsR family regulator
MNATQGKRMRKRVPPVQRLAIALKHPLRARLLTALVGGDGSATQLSRQFGDVSVGDASYHLSVLADECGLIDRVRSRQVRGAVERFFRLRPSVVLAVDSVTVDQLGMAEIDEALEEAIARVKGAELKSRHRLESLGHAATGAAIVVAAIQTRTSGLPSQGVDRDDGSIEGSGALRGTRRSWRSSAPEAAEEAQPRQLGAFSHPVGPQKRP